MILLTIRTPIGCSPLGTAVIGAEAWLPALAGPLPSRAQDQAEIAIGKKASPRPVDISELSADPSVSGSG